MMLPGNSTATNTVHTQSSKAWFKPLAVITSFIMIVSTILLSSDTFAPPASANGGWATHPTDWAGSTNTITSPGSSVMPMVDDQVIYGSNAGTMSYWTISNNGLTATRVQFATATGFDTSTFAVDGHRTQRDTEAGRPNPRPNIYYLWSFANARIYRVEEGSNTAQSVSLPTPATLTPGTGGGWSGGEVVQKTGKLFLSGMNDTTLNNSLASCRGTTGFNFTMMLFDPDTLEYQWSGRLCPKTTGDAMGGIVGSDMALDGNGNAYIMVYNGSPANSFNLVRVVPPQSREGDQTWWYNRVKDNIPTGSTSIWGMAFLNGKLYIGFGDINAQFRAVNPLAGTSDQVFTRDQIILDLGSAQTAFVVDGFVYNDENGNGQIDSGEEGLPGVTIAIYQEMSGTYRLQGTLVTDDSGSYSALLGGRGEYVIRVVQPRIDGINAVQTWASGETLVASDGTNATTPVCYNEGGVVTDPLFDGPCYGAKKMPAPDPKLGDFNSVGDPADFMIYTKASVDSVNDVASANFGVHASGSFGDLGPATIATGAPYHNNADAEEPPVWLGDTLGQYTEPGANVNAHATDDGMELVMACPDGGDCSEGEALNGQMFAQEYDYTLKATLNGDEANTAKVRGWTTTNPTAATPTWGTAPYWSPADSGDVREEDIRFSTTGTYGFRVNVSPADTNITEATNTANRQYYDSTGDGDVPWVTFGEIEDYSFRVVESVVRPALKTIGGPGSATIARPAGTDSWSQAFTNVNGGPKVAMPQVAQSPSGNYTVTNVPADFDVLDVIVTDTESGEPRTGMGPITKNSGGATFTYAPEEKSDVIMTVIIAKKPDPGKSTIELVTPSGVSVGNAQQAKATVVEAGNSPLQSVEVTFTVTDTDLYLCPADAATKDASTCNVKTATCTTDTDGECFVDVFSTLAKTYTDSLSATMEVSGTPANLGMPQPAGTKLSPIFTQSTVDPKNSVFSVSPEADMSDQDSWPMVTTPSTAGGSYTAIATLKDAYGNGVSGLTSTEVVFGTSASQATCTWVGEGSTPGVYTATCTSTLAADDITANVKVNNEQITTDDITVASDPGAVVDLPIPFKAGAPSETCTDSSGTGREGTGIWATPTTTGVGGQSTITVLVTDELCNPVPDVDVTYSLVAGSDATFVGDTNTATTGQDGKASVAITDNTAETVQVNATAGSITFSSNVDGKNAPVDVEFTAGSFDPSTSEFSVAMCDSLTEVKADDTECWTGTLTAKDASGNPTTLDATEQGNLDFDVPDEVTVSSTITDNGDGTYSVTYTSKVAGDHTVSLWYDDGTRMQVGTDETITFVAGDPSETCTDSTGTGREGTALWTDTPTVSVGDNAIITARVTDEFCNPIENAPVAFTLVAGSDASFVGSAAAVTDADGLASATITNDTAETVGVKATSGTINFSDTTVDVTFIAGDISATNSLFTVEQCDATATEVVADGIECWKGTVTPKDAMGNTVPGLSAEQLARFDWGVYSGGTATDLVTVSGVTPNGDNTYSVTYKSTTAGDYTVDLAYNGTQVGSDEDISFVAGDPTVNVPPTCDNGLDGTRIYGEAGYGNLTTKVAGESATITALITDANCNPVPGVTVTFDQDSDTAELDPLTAVTDADGLATVSLTDTVAELVNVTGSIPTNQQIINGSPARVEFTVGEPTVNVPPTCDNGLDGTRIYGEAGYGNLTTKVSGQSATITALITDENCNPVPGVAVTFAKSSTTAEFTSAVTVNTDADGLATVTLKGTVAETVDVTGSIPTNQTIINGSPAQVEFTIGGPTVDVPPTCDNGLSGTQIYGEAGYGNLTTKVAGESVTITALITDENCNPVPGVVVTFDNDSDTAEFDSPTATTDADGIATVVLTGTVAETVNVTASIPTDQQIINGSPAQVEYTVGEPTVNVPPTCDNGLDGTQIYGEAGYGNLTTKVSGQSAAITALITDANCNPVPGVTVTFAKDSDTATFDSTTATTGPDGKATVNLTGTVAETVDVTGSIPTNQTIINGSPAQVEFTIGGPTVVVPPICDNGNSGTQIYGEAGYETLTTKVAGQSATITALITDENCNPVPGVVVTFDNDSDTAEFDSPTATTDADGIATVVLTGTVAETVNVTASIPTDQQIINGSPAQVEYTVGEPTVNVPPTCPNGLEGTRIYGEAGYETLTTKVAGESATITALITDENCNPVPGVAVTFDKSSTTAEFTTAVTVNTDANGLATVTLKGTVAETVDVTGSIPTAQEIINGSPAQVEFTIGGPTVDVPKTCANGQEGTQIYGEAGYGNLTSVEVGQSATITALITDENCNPVPGVVVTFAHDSDTAEFTPVTATTDADGLAVVSIYNETAEMVDVTASIPTNQWIINGSPAQVEFTASDPWTGDCTLPDGTKGVGTNISASPASAEVNGTSEVTAYVTDKYCNPLTGIPVTFDVTGDATYTTATTVDTVDGYARATITDTTAETVDATAMINTTMPIVTGSPAQVEFLAGEADPSRSTFTVAQCDTAATKVLANGEECYTGTLGAFDSYGNPLPGLSAAQLALFVFEAPDEVDMSTLNDNGDGTYTLEYTSIVADTYTVALKYNSAPQVQVGSDQNITFSAGPVELDVDESNCAPGRKGTGMEVTPTSLTTDQSADVSVLITDAFCNPIVGEMVTLTVTGNGELGTYSQATNADGLVETTLSDTTAETVTVHSSVAAGTVPEDTDVTFTVGALDWTASDFNVYMTAGNQHTDKVRADGIDSWTAEFIPKDAGGNLITEPLSPSHRDALNLVTSADVTYVPGPSGTYTWLLTSDVHDTEFLVELYGGTTKVAPMRTNMIEFSRAMPPEPPVITEPAPGADVNTQTPTISGENGEPGSTIKVKDADGNVLCETTADDDGNWSCTVDEPLDEGEVTLYVTATDSEGNESDASDPITINIDVTPPDAPEITSPTPGEYLNTSTPTVTGENGEPGSTITIKDEDGNVLCTTTVDADGNWSCTVDTPMDDGNRTLTVTATDPAGNESEGTTIDFIIDTVPPDPPMIESPAPGAAVNTDTPEFKGKGTKPGSTVEVKDEDGNVLCTATVGPEPDLAWACTPTDPMPEGNHSITAVETDLAGNVSDPSDPLEIRVKTTPPAAPSVDEPERPFGKDVPVIITGNGEEEGNDIIIRGEDENGNIVILCQTKVGPAPDFAWSCELDDQPADGTHELTVVEKDAAGNESEGTPVVIEVKTVPPTDPVVDPTNGSQITGTADDDSKVTVTDENGNPIPGCTDLVPVDGKFFCEPQPPLAPGSTIKVQATDRAGNISGEVTATVRALESAITHPKRYRGEEQIVTGYNFNPGEKVNLTVYSDPFDAGTGTANSDGTVTIKFTVPQDMEYTTHTARLTGEQSGSAPDVTFEVIARPVSVPTGGTTLPGAALPLSLMVLGALIALGGFQGLSRTRNGA